VGIFSSRIFFIGQTSRKYFNGEPVLALFSSDLNGRTLELIEGVEMMIVRYGEIINDELIYKARENVSHWKNVISLRVNVLFNSVEEGLQKPRQYYFNGKNTMPNDRLMRQEFSFEWAIKGM
jgi:hypothetical protein